MIIIFSRWLFLKSFYLFWDAIFLGYHINYLSIWTFVCHPWFPTRKASRLTFVCFQVQLFSPCILFNTWCWKQTNVRFEAFPVGNEGWHIKGQMLRYLIWYPQNIFILSGLSMCMDKVDFKKSHLEKKWFFCIFFQSTPHQVVVECYNDFFGYFNALETNGVQWRTLIRSFKKMYKFSVIAIKYVMISLCQILTSKHHYDFFFLKHFLQIYLRNWLDLDKVAPWGILGETPPAPRVRLGESKREDIVKPCNLLGDSKV